MDIKAQVILGNGKKMIENYGNINLSSNIDIVNYINKYILFEWNCTAELGYDKTLNKVWIKQSDKSDLLIYPFFDKGISDEPKTGKIYKRNSNIGDVYSNLFKEGCIYEEIEDTPSIPELMSLSCCKREVESELNPLSVSVVVVRRCDFDEI